MKSVAQRAEEMTLGVNLRLTMQVGKTSVRPLLLELEGELGHWLTAAVLELAVCL